MKGARIAFPAGMNYHVLVLPRCETMTPRLVQKIKELVETGATVLGQPPRRSPSLSGYPQCDNEVRSIAAELWGTAAEGWRNVGKGRILRPRKPSVEPLPADLYPSYATVAGDLSGMGILPDFESDAPLRYTHRQDGDDEIYFVANRSDQPQTAVCQFRVVGKLPERWDPVTGRRYVVPIALLSKRQDGRTAVQLEFAPYQSALFVFRKTKSAAPLRPRPDGQLRSLTDLSGPWEVFFDPTWGGPEKIIFATLDDWTQRPEEGIRHYSGKAVYRKHFDLSSNVLKRTKADSRLSLGAVHDMASVKLNGRDFGVVWCDPWEVDIPAGLLREQGNELEITVANRWPNRMIGDQSLPPEKRRTKTTWNPFHKDSPLLPSGLIGPVQVIAAE
jgi:hypothetical protein